MKATTAQRLDKIANLLETLVTKSINGGANAIHFLLIDGVFGKSKYRKRGAKMRPIIHRTYNRTVYVRPAPVVHIVKGSKHEKEAA